MQRVEVFKEDKCQHDRVAQRPLWTVCSKCGEHEYFVTTSELQILKDEIALLKQRSHTHKFTGTIACSCHEAPCMCPRLPQANY